MPSHTRSHEFNFHSLNWLHTNSVEKTTVYLANWLLVGTIKSNTTLTMSNELSSLESSLSSLPSRKYELHKLGQAENVIKILSKPSCCLRRVKNKGAILILILSFLVTSVYFYILDIVSRQTNVRPMVAIMGLTLPLAGWVADVHYGRHKILSCSLWMMWISSLFLTVTLVAANFTNYKHEIIPVTILLVPLGIGWGGFQATIIQFGIDQLIDASTSELKSFIAWYSWTYIASQLMIYCVLHCVRYKLLCSFLICFNVTLALTLKLLFANVLIKEPKTHNPCKLVYQVIQYAVRHKYPRQRSAFTYCEDVVPSRIDFGKSKYGGPYTTEQVEDVKTFLRIIVVILVGSLVYSISNEGHFTKSKLNSVFLNQSTIRSMTECSTDLIFTGFYFISGTLLIPLYELLIYPLFHKYLPNVTSLCKYALGAILRLAKLTVFLILVTCSRLNFSKDVEISKNSTLPCLFHQPTGTSYLDYRWITVPEFIYASSDMIFYIGTLEFLCAQVPYSMKGLVLGTTYAFLGVFIPSFNALELLYGKRSLNWGSGVISCGFWYFITKISLLIAATIVFFIIMKWYKKRKREDVLPNEQIFAEEYYSRGELPVPAIDTTDCHKKTCCYS